MNTQPLNRANESLVDIIYGKHRMHVSQLIHVKWDVIRIGLYSAVVVLYNS